MSIDIHGAREHNLQNIDVTIGDGLTVVTGVSGSGKSSLIFDTLYHEARRRFLDIFAIGSSTERLAPAAVRTIDGLGPAVAVGQNLLNRNPNSTLATASGLHPFLRLLYANFGRQYCAHCGAAVVIYSADRLIEHLQLLVAQAPVTVAAPLMHNSVGSHRTFLSLLREQLDGERIYVDDQPWDGRPIDPQHPHSVTITVAELDAESSLQQLRNALAQVHALGAATVELRHRDTTEQLSDKAICTTCGVPIAELTPTHFHTPCPHCQGNGCNRCEQSGLTPVAAAVRWHDLRLPDLLAQTVDQLHEQVEASYTASTPLAASAARLHDEILRRLVALRKVGLGYLTLDRPSPTLSRGEAQRVRLAIILTSRLEDMLHVLDEPTVGQHPADVLRLLPAFRELAGPVVYVEHDRLAAAAADQALDLGPAAGGGGGQLLFNGTPADLWRADTASGRFFSLREQVQIPPHRPASQEFITIERAALRTLQAFDVNFPVGALTVVTGVSGSGKSTLVRDVLVASLKADRPVGCLTLAGPRLDPVMVDQSPIGQNPRSNPATYTTLANSIRDCYANATGLSPSHFSFNRPEGACPACKGLGAVEVQMRYLPSIWIPCAACNGQRFSDEVLAATVDFGGQQLSVAEFFASSVDDASLLLHETPYLSLAKRRSAHRMLAALRDVGLGYLPLGQPSTTLSGGEAQRVKLAKYLGGRNLDQKLLVLDEPTTGLHPQDVAGLLTAVDRLVRAGATVVVVEHSTDLMRAADWIIDLGPHAGPAGGRLLYAGPFAGLTDVADSQTAQALREEPSMTPETFTSEPFMLGTSTAGASTPGTSTLEDATKTLDIAPSRWRDELVVENAHAHNLQNVTAHFPKGQLTVVTGLSGSGKSSLVHNVLEAEARRRFLETLSLYERQSTREGPEAPVDAVRGLGVAITVDTARSRFSRRATVGTTTEIDHHLAILFANVGERHCPMCGAAMQRTIQAQTPYWGCNSCGHRLPVARPHHFSPTTYAAACTTCHGVGSLQVPQPEKLIIAPEKPLCSGAMYSPGFFPQGFLCQPYNSGYDLVQALAARYEFDPMQTPWDKLPAEVQQAFLFGTEEKLPVTFESRTGRVRQEERSFPGFYGWIRDWDVGGTYTRTEPCPACGGARLRADYLAVTVAGNNIHELREMPLAELATILANPLLPPITAADTLIEFALTSLATVQRRLHFLCQVGLGYLHLNRITATLSAGEAQRIKLASLLGSGLGSLTVLLDEPTRGMHPSEVGALLVALKALRDEGNTVIVVEHELSLIAGADHVVDIGPGAGTAGGQIVATGAPQEIARAETPTGRWLRHELAQESPPLPHRSTRREPTGWLTIRGARANNLAGQTVEIPLGLMVGICGVSGSGKSTLIVDTLGRALAPKKQTTSVAYEPVEPGIHDAITGMPARVIVVDQRRAEITNPADFLNLTSTLRKLYAATADAHLLGLDEAALRRTCTGCNGRGFVRTDMGFLPAFETPCDLCQGTGYPPEAWALQLAGLPFPALFGLTIDELDKRFGDEARLARPLQMAQAVGLGYLVLRQPGHALSGGEAQRLKIAKELCRKSRRDTLYLLDEPTVGQHAEDVARLIDVLARLVDGDETQQRRDGGATPNSVIVIEHHPQLLAACDWLIELGPGGGPAGGLVIATGSPAEVAAGNTPTAPYLYA